MRLLETALAESGGLLLLGLALILAGALVESRAILLVTAGSGALP
ncbi:hypothetical protein [Limnochorda pilosa]|uniref:Uncharacterized protein n=1 Tax=Limnochorda pilosa TaxID=1555112 RepID=A0A0K2SN71_LIMPI|nr:hypothetical protein [Limnochorda pilosa]BAS28561.1 hypothetical protein LIP_2731 [Limnochorda pilosa]